MIKFFPRNPKGRDFIVGDIHGCFTKLWQQLTESPGDAGFDITRDRLFSVGDLVDRGPESHLSLDWLAQPWFHAIRGNHEDMAIRFPREHMDEVLYSMNGGLWNIKNSVDIREQFSEAFSKLPYSIQLETEEGLVGLVHAECPAKDWRTWVNDLLNGNSDHQKSTALWSRSRIHHDDDELVDNIAAVVCGHTPLPEPKILGNHMYIDTIGWRNGRFTIIEASEVIQKVRAHAAGSRP